MLLQPPQYQALPQPLQVPALPAPQQPLAIAYNPRGEKRKNTEIREEDRQRIILDDDRTDSVKRKSDGDDGKGEKEAYS